MWRSASSLAGRPVNQNMISILITFVILTAQPPPYWAITFPRLLFKRVPAQEATRPSPHLTDAAPLKEIPPEVSKSRCSGGNEPDNGTVRWCYLDRQGNLRDQTEPSVEESYMLTSCHSLLSQNQGGIRN